MKIKLRYIFLLVFINIIASSSISFALTQNAKEKLKFLEKKGVEAIEMPDIEKEKLGIGIDVNVLTDNDSPLVKMIIYIKGGSVYEPISKKGLSTILAGLLRIGGTQDALPKEIDERLDYIGSSISISSSTEYFVASLTSSKKHFKETQSILLDMLFNPAFDNDRFLLLKKQLANSILRRDDSPESLASIGFTSLLYGRNNQWGAYPTIKTISEIEINDIKEFYEKYFHPQNMIAGISGDISFDKATNVLKKYKKYPTSKPVDIDLPKATPSPQEGVFIINKDISQAVINMGFQGSDRFNPDKYALIVMNDIIGGGSFKARLPKLIRVERGLAYSVWSAYTFGPKVAPGYFKIFLATKISSSKDALDICMQELDKFAQGEGISEEELIRAKTSILKSLIFEYSTSFDIIANYVRFKYFGYPENYIKVFEDGIKAVTLPDVKRVSKKYLKVDNLQTVIVGNAGKVESLLKDSFKSKIITIDK